MGLLPPPVDEPHDPVRRLLDPEAGDVYIPVPVANPDDATATGYGSVAHHSPSRDEGRQIWTEWGILADNADTLAVRTR